MRRILLSMTLILLVSPWPATADEPLFTGSYFAVIVEDIAASAEWYSRTFGLDPGTHLEEEGRYRIVNLHRPGLFIELLQLADAAPRPDERQHGPFKLGALVADLETFVAALPDSENPLRILDDAENELRLLQLRDPDGNIVQVMQRVATD